ncbi:MAG: hypothetical protein D6753_10395 [Planctomycetota bacterium]|nr:MAG: hypothetical protein D6753_10395 [Planctomycetota bacterium]
MLRREAFSAEPTAASTIPFSQAQASAARMREDRVPVAAGDALAILLHAARTNRAWLDDFADETIMVSRDLYELMLAYRQIAFESNRQAA